MSMHNSAQSVSCLLYSSACSSAVCIWHRVCHKPLSRSDCFFGFSHIQNPFTFSEVLSTCSTIWFLTFCFSLSFKPSHLGGETLPAQQTPPFLQSASSLSVNYTAWGLSALPWLLLVCGELLQLTERRYCGVLQRNTQSWFSAHEVVCPWRCISFLCHVKEAYIAGCVAPQMWWVFPLVRHPCAVILVLKFDHQSQTFLGTISWHPIKLIDEPFQVFHLLLTCTGAVMTWRGSPWLEATDPVKRGISEWHSLTQRVWDALLFGKSSIELRKTRPQSSTSIRFQSHLHPKCTELGWKTQ